MYLRKTLFVALLLAVVILPATSHATISRVIGLGGAESHYIVKDAYNYSVWPQLVRHYGMQSGAEFYAAGTNGYDFQKAYIIYDFGDGKSALSFALDKLNSRNYGMLANNELAALDNIEGGYNKLNVTYGRPMGDNMLIGAALHFAGKSYSADENAPGGKVDNSYSEIGLLLGLTAMEDKLDVSLGFRSGSWSLENAGGTVAEADGASDIMLAGRYWYEANENYKIIPSLALNMHTDNAKVGTAAHEYSSSMFRLGVGNNWTPKEDMLAIAEFGLKSVGETMKPDGGDEATDSESSIFWRLGIESEIFSWMKARFGAQRDWLGATEESAAGKPEYSTSVTSTYLGTTVHRNRCQADLVVHPDFLCYGPNFVSGYQGMLFTRASVKINFDKI
ncbi:MAG: hypothetical protein IPK53_12805 [bacterium]|nr:hypothetical protein [bacterium]